MRRPVFFFLILVVLLELIACRMSVRRASKMPAIKGEVVHAVVEIPAGTCRLRAFGQGERLLPLKELGERLPFLPFPGNFGFVPSTDAGGGAPLDVLVLSEAVPEGALQVVVPVGVLAVSRRGWSGHVIVAVPEEERLRSLPVGRFQEIGVNYQPAQLLLSQWLEDAFVGQELRVLGWRDETVAWELVRQAAKPR